MAHPPSGSLMSDVRVFPPDQASQVSVLRQFTLAVINRESAVVNVGHS